MLLWSVCEIILTIPVQILSQKVSLVVTKVVNGVWVDHWLAYNGVKVGAGALLARLYT